MLLFNEIQNVAYVGFGIISANIIDSIGINKATNIAAERSLITNKFLYNKLLIDGNINVQNDKEIENIIKGDSNYVSIAAASIIAKVIRDNIMTTYSKIYNCYLWEKNKGYGTKDHLLAIKKYGKTKIHRYTYRIK